jgi:hypothetical protein
VAPLVPVIGERHATAAAGRGAGGAGRGGRSRGVAVALARPHSGVKAHGC